MSKSKEGNLVKVASKWEQIFRQTLLMAGKSAPTSYMTHFDAAMIACEELRDTQALEYLNSLLDSEFVNQVDKCLAAKLLKKLEDKS